MNNVAAPDMMQTINTFINLGKTRLSRGHIVVTARGTVANTT
jgi:hypothetical protein